MTPLKIKPQVPLWAALLLLLLPRPAAAEMDHAAHRAMLESQGSLARTQARYVVPDVVLLNQEGEKVQLKAFLASSEPYALNFIFTTCTTTCPILTSSFRQMQHQLEDDAQGLQIISITIDPEYDTPAVLKAYAKKVGATRNWTFLTGDFATIEQVEKAFNAFTPDKMQHRPAYLFKVGKDETWTRIDGLASGAELAQVYQSLDLFR